MILKDYQIKVVKALKQFYTEAEKQKSAIEKLDESVRKNLSYVDATYAALNLDFKDRPKNGLGHKYPRFTLKIPTGGGKTLLAIEAIREYQNIFAKKRTGLVVWITHRDTIYSQTIEKLKDKGHIYRQWLDQTSGNKTIILEKGQSLRRQDVEENLVVLMLMMPSMNRSSKEVLKVFQDSGGYMEFFPPENQHDKHEKILEKIPNLDFIEDNLFNKKIVKTSMANAIRTLNPLIIVDEFHTMFSDRAKETLDGLNPAMIIGLSATPKERAYMNVLIEITGQELNNEEMIKLELHLNPPTTSGDWREMIDRIKDKREFLEKKAKQLMSNKSVYIRPIALMQVERTGKEQRGKGYVHSEDVREYLIQKGIPPQDIAVKSSELDEIKEEKLLSQSSEIRYIITKEALKEGWDCSFAYILGVIPNARTESSMTQLVGRILRQPYAKKTGVKELDESYVFFTKGNTRDVLENIKRGFKQEGLGDLVQGIGREAGPTGSRAVKVKLKKDILKNYPESLYLPNWVIKDGKGYRRFSYDIDIKPNLDWNKLNYKKWLEKEILPALAEQDDTFEFLVNLDDERKEYFESEYLDTFDAKYLSRRIMEVVDNAFVSIELAKKVVSFSNKHKNKKLIQANSGFITQEVVKRITKEKEKQEKEIFFELVKTNEVRPVVSEDPDIGYRLPEENAIYPEGVETFKRNLFEKSDILSMNSLEEKIADLMDKKDNVIWWTRNVSGGKQWYALRGWRKGKIRPDFIAAKRAEDGALELVYIIESKGEHLIDNPDTQYKKAVFDKINNKKISSVSSAMLKFKLNKEFQFELVEQGDEDMAVNRFFQ